VYAEISFFHDCFNTAVELKVSMNPVPRNYEEAVCFLAEWFTLISNEN